MEGMTINNLKLWAYMKKYFAATPVVLSVLLILSGCVTSRRQRGLSIERPAAAVPVLAVASFNNQSGFSGQWNLGDGMADMLTTSLVETGEVTVLERQQIKSVIDEIIMQGQSLFRREGGVRTGRLKNARYLVSGSVTDFTVTNDSSGWFSASRLRAWGRRSRSRVSLHLRISDIESGEVIASVKGSAAASAGWFGGDVDYQRHSFGGQAFAQTPLGRATERAIDRAVREILRAIPREQISLQVAYSDSEMVIINAGSNAGVRVGDRFIVRKQGHEVTDPATGDTIETLPGRIAARIEVYRVKDNSAHAVYNEGQAERGDLLAREPNERGAN